MPEVLPELGALAAAGFLLLIAAALWVLQGVITNSLGRLPVVGSWVSQHMNDALNDARNLVLAGAASSWGAAGQMFRWAEDFIRNTSNTLFNLSVSAVIFGQRLFTVTLPGLEDRLLVTISDAYGQSVSYAGILYNDARGYASSLVSQALATAAGWVNYTENLAVTLYDRASAAIVNGIATAETDAANALANASTTLKTDIVAAETLAVDDIDALQSSVQAAIDTLSNDIVTGVQTAETLAAHNLASAVGSIYTDLDTAADKAVSEAWPDAAGELAHLGGTLGQDFPWLKDLLGALGGLGVAGLAGSLIRSMATSQALTRLADDCVVPQCRNLGGLSNDLGNLLSDASTAAMLAWLIFAVTDPAGWSAEMETVAAPIASGLSESAAKLFGEG
jgi:hypothetical protein